MDYLFQHDVVHKAVRTEFFERGEKLLKSAAESWPNDPLVPVHADFGRWNVRWAGPEVPVVIDFDDLGLGIAWQDICLFPHSLVSQGVCSRESMIIFVIYLKKSGEHRSTPRELGFIGCS